MSRGSRRPIPHDLRLDARTLEPLRAALPRVGDDVVAAIIAEVPAYSQALAGPMGQTIRNAVQLALGGFISLAGRQRPRPDSSGPTAPAMEGAYQLGRGEARSGRSMEALLAAYRIGARISWREMSGTAVRAELDSETMAAFAELVFTYIDELSAASAAGHADELATSGRVLERLLERLCTLLVTEAPEDRIRVAAEQAEWTPPRTLTAAMVPAARLRGVLPSLPAGTLVAPAELVEDDDRALVLVPEAHDRARAALLRGLADTDSVVGPARPWLRVAASVRRVRQAIALGLAGDTDQHLGALVRGADPEAVDDLAARVLAPLSGVRPATRDKLVETLGSWLRHQGRREGVAAELFVHPQTVRYRMGRLRELYGERLTDPAFVRDATIALG